MTFEAVRDAVNSSPFRPFRVHEESGEVYQVPCRSAVFLTQSTPIVGTEIGSDGIPDGFRLCAFHQIRALSAME